MLLRVQGIRDGLRVRMFLGILRFHALGSRDKLHAFPPLSCNGGVCKVPPLERRGRSGMLAGHIPTSPKRFLPCMVPKLLFVRS
jgi:hypothetical protein